MSERPVVLVLDDLRELPYTAMDGHVEVHHAKTNEQFNDLLNVMVERYRKDGTPIMNVVLDHDLGGVAFGEETARDSIKLMCHLHRTGEIDVVSAIVVTMNPAGQEWIASELDAVDIAYQIDPGGVGIGMVVPSDDLPSYY